MLCHLLDRGSISRRAGLAGCTVVCGGKVARWACTACGGACDVGKGARRAACTLIRAILTCKESWCAGGALSVAQLYL